jgi:glycosyltransferase involved in cell wall biosynthesis
MTRASHPDCATSSSSSRLLYLGHDIPWPVITGGRVRDATLLAAASTEWHLDAIVVAEPDILARDRSSIPALFESAVRPFPDESPTRPWPCRQSWAARDAIDSLCARGVDAVHVEGSYLLDLLPESVLGRTVLVEHNIESDLLEQRRVLGVDTVTPDDVRSARTREERAWRAVAQLVTLTEEDAAVVRARQPDLRPRVVPNGWDHLPPTATRPARPLRWLRAPRLLFVANYRYGPNRDALNWLVDEVFPLVQRLVPRASVTIAGANLDAATSARLDRGGVTVTGPFSDVTAVLDAADIVVCPLRMGGGIKVKIIEALRRGCTVVTTTIGAQGVHGPARRALAIGDSAQALAEQVARLCDPAERAAAWRHLAEGLQHAPRWADCYQRLSRLWREVCVPVRTAS